VIVSEIIIIVCLFGILADHPRWLHNPPDCA
jgi:hypothetical protein